MSKEVQAKLTMEDLCLTFSEMKEVEIKWKVLSVLSEGDWLSYLFLSNQ